jgi:cytosine/adenosine deaminase-related metal-dependent hydrolase
VHRQRTPTEDCPDQIGPLGPDLTVVHGNEARRDDLRRLADHGVERALGDRRRRRPVHPDALRAGRTPDGRRARRAVLPAGEVPRMATVHGARTAGLGGRVGSLEPGKAADIVLPRTDAVGLAPLRHAADAVVLAAHPGMAGTVVKRHGELLADVGRARALAAEALEWVIAG